MRRSISRAAPALALAFAATVVAAGQQPADQEGFRFKSGVELINVTATVTDRSGRFVANLQQDDFLVWDDDQPMEITHFSAERVPVSLGIVLDTSGSMAGEKMYAARDAIERFLAQLVDRDDEVFLYTFDSRAELVHDWTSDMTSVSESLRRIHPRGGTAMYDAVAEAVPMAQSGRNRKKAIVVISDGNDTNSRIGVREVKQLVRETEVLVYAVGIDGEGTPTISGSPPIVRPRPPFPVPFPFPGGGRRTPWPQPQPLPPGAGRTAGDERVNVAALRDMTDDSGGRTEIVREPRDLDPATSSIADELSKQYYLGYAAPGWRDGRWHTIRVELSHSEPYRVRARRGYVANP